MSDFFYSLHNAWTGGVWYCINHNIGSKYYDQFYELLEKYDIPIQEEPLYGEWLAQFSLGVTDIFSTKGYYDYLETTNPNPEKSMSTGACSWDYLADIKPEAITLLGEFAYVKHPLEQSKRGTGEHQRELLLRIDADVKFIVTVILEEWDKVKADLNVESAFYEKTYKGMIAMKDNLSEGLPSWPYKTRDILFNPIYSKEMNEGERFDMLMIKYGLLCHCYEAVRLLKASTPSPAVTNAIARLDSLFDSAMADIGKTVDLGAFEVIDCSTLAKAQLGSGLIALNAVLERSAVAAAPAMQSS